MNLCKLRFLARVGLLALPLAFCSARADDHTVSIDFPGGPLSKLVTELSKENKISIISPGGLDPVLPAFSVHDAHIPSLIGALGQLLEPEGYRFNATGENLAVLTRPDRHPSQDFAVFRLDHMLGSRSVEDIVAAIQAACEFAFPDNKDSPLRCKYHPGTKLLFLAGTDQEISVAARVITNLPTDDVPEKASAEKK